MSAQSTNSGIVTDTGSGERHIPESTRPDGTTRKAIKIRPGYKPPEDVEVYKNRTAETFRNRGKGGIPGAEGLNDNDAEPASGASNKNAKRREARKKAKAAAEPQNEASAQEQTGPEANADEADEADPEAEREKKARNLRKKLKQAKELKLKKDGGETLLPEQIAKVIKINELIRELEALGYDANGEPRAGGPDPSNTGENH